MYVPTVPKIKYKVGTQKGPPTFFGQFVYYAHEKHEIGQRIEMQRWYFPNLAIFRFSAVCLVFKFFFI